MSIKVFIARTRDELDACFAIRYRVFVEELGIFSKDGFVHAIETDEFDRLPTTTNILVQVDGTAAATVRLLLPNREIADHNGWEHGLAIERHFVLPKLPKNSVAELPRSSVLPEYRGRLLPPLMWAMATQVAGEHGIRTFVAEAFPEAKELWIVQRYHSMLASVGLVLSGIECTPRQAQPLNHIPFHGLINRKDAIRRLPPALKLFVGMGAVVCGSPIHVPDFNGISIPIFWDLDAMTPDQRRIFDRAKARLCTLPSQSTL